ncbi:hypothetical protein [uncultured Mailhella sp.]|uniref:hypothetical protein n=1 Tax=uncultured Mailhella sp. TaxID=1981031 RepID=UPI0025EAAA67|nr:hypothetical protein [uncultured Mailhella sp.]
MIDKSLQIALLKEVAPTYPGLALPVWEKLVEMAPGENRKEKLAALVVHLAALEECGYIEKFSQLSPDGRLSINQGFRITVNGLLEAGEDVLHPAPDKELREALLKQAGEIRTLSEGQKTSVRKVLTEFPKAALLHLQEKGLDSLLTLMFG